MAEHALIERYLGELQREVRWLRDAEEIVAEVADHLLEAVAIHARRGLDQTEAARHALAEFGDPTLVGRAFASSRSGGIAVPTNFTRRAGVALLASSALWLIAPPLFYWSDLADRSRPWEGLPQILFGIGTYTLMVGGLLLVVGIVGVTRRHGGALGSLGRLAFLLASVVAVTSLAAWAWGVWLTALGGTALLLAIALSRSGIAPRPAGMLIGVGGAIAVGAPWAYQLAGTEVDLGGGAVTALIFAGLAIHALGLAWVGAWLRSEEPVDVPQEAAPA